MNINPIPFLRATCLIILFLLLHAPRLHAGFPIKKPNSNSAYAGITPVQADSPTDSRQSKFLKKLELLKEKQTANQSDNAARPARPLRSGIFGRLAFYLGLLSVISLILLLFTLTANIAGTYAGIWLISSFLAIILGLIGLHKRRKKGMALAGLVIGLGEVALMFALASFISAVAANLPAIMATIFVLGRG